MSDDLKLAETSITSTPWWATAPIWLAAGIVGVPSMIALGAGYFIVKGVASRLDQNGTRAMEAIKNIDTLNDQVKIFHDQDQKEFHLLRDYLGQIVRIEFRSCVHEAHTDKERDDCLRTAKQDIERLQATP